MAPERNRMTVKNRLGLALLALMGDEEFLRSPTGCPCCGSQRKAETGECSDCGVFVCETCSKMHLGEPRPCPGRGVPVPVPNTRR